MSGCPGGGDMKGQGPPPWGMKTVGSFALFQDMTEFPVLLPDHPSNDGLSEIVSLEQNPSMAIQ